jgi:mannose-6-phosphate isomerase-like protein (cupin superfamily)
METSLPTVIDLTAEAAKLTMFRGRTPQTTFAERRAHGSAVNLGRYRDGMLLLARSAGTAHWETHAEDELLYVLDGVMRVDILEKDGPRSFNAGTGTLVIVPPAAWHRVHSEDGATVASATMPGEHIDLDVEDPRPAGAAPVSEVEHRPLRIIDLGSELAKLTMFRGRTPQSTMADRKGSSARLASYRDGGLSVTKFAGKGHWEAHLAGDELIYIVGGTATLESLGEDGPQSFALRAGMIAVNRQGAWHRFQSSGGVTLMAVTPLPSEVIEVDVDDPRTVHRAPV